MHKMSEKVIEYWLRILTSASSDNASVSREASISLCASTCESTPDRLPEEMREEMD